MNEISKNIGMKVQKYRKKKNITQDQLAKMMYKTNSVVCKLELGKKIIDVEELVLISQALNVPIESFFEDFIN